MKIKTKLYPRVRAGTAPIHPNLAGKWPSGPSPSRTPPYHLTPSLPPGGRRRVVGVSFRAAIGLVCLYTVKLPPKKQGGQNRSKNGSPQPCTSAQGSSKSLFKLRSRISSILGGPSIRFPHKNPRVGATPPPPFPGGFGRETAVWTPKNERNPGAKMSSGMPPDCYTSPGRAKGHL